MAFIFPSIPLLPNPPGTMTPWQFFNSSTALVRQLADFSYDSASSQVISGFNYRKIRIGQYKISRAEIFADNADLDRHLGTFDTGYKIVPFPEIFLIRSKIEFFQNPSANIVFFKVYGNLIY